MQLAELRRPCGASETPEGPPERECHGPNYSPAMAAHGAAQLPPVDLDSYKHRAQGTTMVSLAIEQAKVRFGTLLAICGRSSQSSMLIL